MYEIDPPMIRKPNLAWEIKSVCGRRFQIGHSKANVQCRTCDRWWSGAELSALGVAAILYTTEGQRRFPR